SAGLSVFLGGFCVVGMDYFWFLVVADSFYTSVMGSGRLFSSYLGTSQYAHLQGVQKLDVVNLRAPVSVRSM
ncbi:MAG: hypothetical protein NTY03_14965, partial [Candidatus Bathyarchaeota archaeon]|nr:hypothetical protein [Candidatus Bathyarchaeota archaeon]